MKKISFLLVLFMVFLLFGCRNKKVDIKDTGFEYDVPVCDQYFEVVDCIIDKDTNENYTKAMRNELRTEVKKMQKEWKQLNEEELTDKCTEELAKYEDMEENLNSFGCSVKNIK